MSATGRRREISVYRGIRGGDTRTENGKDGRYDINGSATNIARTFISLWRHVVGGTGRERPCGYKRRIRKFRGSMKNATAELSSTWIFHRLRVKSWSRATREILRLLLLYRLLPLAILPRQFRFPLSKRMCSKHPLRSSGLTDGERNHPPWTTPTSWLPQTVACMM